MYCYNVLYLYGKDDTDDYDDYDDADHDVDR